VSDEGSHWRPLVSGDVAGENRIVLVGLAPAQRVARLPALGEQAATGRRLAELAGVRLLDVFATVNVLQEPDARVHGDHATRHGRSLARYLGGRRRVVCVGQDVARLLGYAHGAGHPLFEWTTFGGSPLYALVPHTSGLSRWWNEKTNAERARTWWRGLVADEVARRGAGS